MERELRELLEPYLTPDVLAGVPGVEARALAHIARTFLDWDGPLDVREIEAVLREPVGS